MTETYEDEIPAEDVLQDETPGPGPVVPVCVHGPVQTRELPSRTSSIRAYSLDATTPVRILDADPRRKRGVVMGTDDILVGESPAQVLAAGSRGTFPLALVGKVDWLSGDALWAMAAAGTADVTMLNDQWAL